MKGIIFDVDGTLWDSTREVAVAWNKVLQDEMEGHEILTAEGLQKEFGKPMDAIAESLFPEMSEKDRMELLVQKFLNKWTIFLFCSILFSSNQKEH